MEDKCVCCGEYVPEGRQVCIACMKKQKVILVNEAEGEIKLIKLGKVELHSGICETLNDIYERKNHDYGDSFAKLRNELPNAILVRIYDKYSRLKTLMQGADQKVKDESIDDTLMDLANYCIMELVERKVKENDQKGTY